MMLKLTSSSTSTAAGVARPARGCNAAVPRPCVSLRGQQQQQPSRSSRLQRLVVRASEADVEQQQQQQAEQSAQEVEQQKNGNGATAEASTQSSQEEEPATSTSEQGEEQTPLQRAQQALAAAPIDQELLEASLAELEEEMTRLREGVTAAESRAQMLEGTLQTAKDQLLRLNADFDNFRRRSAAEKEAIAGNVKGDVVAELLPLVDNFELARTQVKVESEGENKINSSYQALYKQMVEVMRSFGIEAVPTVGTPFDPEIHEAIMREPSEEIEEGCVSLEFRKGFRMGDKLVRPAMVKVSMGAPDASPPQAEGGSEGGAEPSA